MKATKENMTAVMAFLDEELEKSVVARVADDVKVSIRGRKVELTIQKKLT